MAKLRARLGNATNAAYPLSFNDIIGHTPGRKGRKDAKIGKYEDCKGRILIVATKDPTFVKTKGTKTGYSRAGMLMVSNGIARLVRCDKSAGGAKRWREYTGDVTL